MNYVKNLIKILLFVQCLLFCVCDKKEATIVEKTEVEATEIVTTEQNELNLVDFGKWPFNDKLKNTTNLEKYVLKKFGKPDRVIKDRGPLGHGDAENIITDIIILQYFVENPSDKYEFEIYRGVSKRFEFFKYISMYNLIDLKYGINETTTMRDIENLFGKPSLDGRDEEVENLQRKGSDAYSYTGSYRYGHNNDGHLYYYLFDFGFRKGKLVYIYITTVIRAEKL